VLSQDHVAPNVFFLAAAGYETTAALIGSTALALLESPLLVQCATGADLVPGGIDSSGAQHASPKGPSDAVQADGNAHTTRSHTSRRNAPFARCLVTPHPPSLLQCALNALG
jgi:hypothetical protein